MRLRITAGRFIAAALACSACSDGPTDGDGGNDGNGGPQRTITLLGQAPAPARLVARNDALYWLDASDEPLSRLTIPGREYLALVTPLPHLESAVSDGAYVYWLAGGRLYRTSVDGAAPTLLHEGTRDLASGVTAAIAMDATHLYWANTVASPSCSPACTFTIMRMPKAGGAATTIATTSRTIVALAVFGGEVFWEEGSVEPVNAEGTVGSHIRKVADQGGPVTVLVNGRLNGLIPPPDGVLPASWDAQGGIAVDASHVYFGDAHFDSYRLLRVPAAGAEGAIEIVTEVAVPDRGHAVRDLELVGDVVYWVDATSLKSVAKAGGTAADLATGLTSPVRLAYEGGTLFWLETQCCPHGQKGTIKRLPTTGGTPAVVRADIDAPLTIAVDAAAVFWVEGGPIGQTEGFGRLARVAPGGGGEAILLEIAGGGPFDVDATHIYFANAFTVKRAPLTGGRAERLAIGDFYVKDVVTDGEYVYWVEGPEAVVRRVPVAGGAVTTLGVASGPPGPIRVDATHVYWMGHEDEIRRVPKGGGTATTVVGPVPGSITDFVVTGGNVYYAEWDGARLRRVPAAGGTAVTLGTQIPDQTRRLATDGVNLYWIDQLDLARMPLTGGTPEFIVLGALDSDPFLASTVAVDANRVYWTETGVNALKMATPK